MVVGEIADTVDIVVVGGGPGGYVAAIRAAQLGKTVSLVESGGRAGLGGSCLAVGCIPSKTLIELAEQYDRVAGGRVAGLTLHRPAINMVAFRREAVARIDKLAKGVGQLLDKYGVGIIEGRARFGQRNRIAVERVDGQSSFLEFTGVVIATGSSASAVSALPADGVDVLDSTMALALDHVPSVMTVVGAGCIGIELATAFAKLGSEVTIIEGQGRVLPRFDGDVVAPLMSTLKRLGVRVLVDSCVVGADSGHLIVATAHGEDRVRSGVTVVAAGRSPNTSDLGLDRAGLTIDADGYLHPDDRCLLRAGIAAIGDVTPGLALAHRAMAQATVAAEALAGLPTRFDPAAVPSVVFADPEIATVGLTEAEARAQGMDVAVGIFPVSASGRAATLGSRSGFSKLVINRSEDRVVGGCVVGPHASELIAEIGLAVEMTASPHDLLGTIHPHPTMSEGIHEAAALAAGQPIHRFA